MNKNFVNYPENGNKAPVWLLVSYAGVIIFFLVAGFTFFIFQYTKFRQITEERILSYCKLKVDQVDQWRDERLQDANMEKTGIEWLNNKNNFNVHYASLLRNSEYTNALQADVHGTVIRQFKEGPSQLPSVTMTALKTAFQKQEPVFSEFFLDKDSAQFIDLIAPVFAKINDSLIPRGAIILRINPKEKLFPLIQSQPYTYNTFEVSLVERKGNYVLYLNDSRFLKNSAMRLKIPLTDLQRPSVRAVLGYQGMFTGENVLGKKVLSFMLRIPDSPWYMISKVNYNEAFSALLSRGIIILLTTLFAIAAALALLAFLWKKSQQKYFQAMYQSELSRKVLLKHFEYLVKYANDIIILTDESLKIIECNERAIEEYGYSYEEMKNMLFSDLIAIDDKPNFYAKLKELRDQTSYLREGRHRRKDGSVFPAETSGRFITIDDKKYYQGIIRNITERKTAENQILKANQELARKYQDLQAAESKLAVSYQELQTAEEELRQQNEELLIIREALEKSENHLNLAQQIVSLGSWTYNFNYDASYWSDEMFHILGIEKTEFPSKELFFEHVTHDDRKKYLEWIEQLKTGKNTNDLEFRIWRNNGEIRTLSGKGILQDRKPTGLTNLVGTFIDITERKQMEEELIKAKEKAEESDYLKTAFLQNMSHEIRTPMNAIVGFSQLMQDHLSDPEKLREFSDIVVNRSHDLLDIIDEILEISRIEAGSMEVNFSEADLNHQLEDLNFFFANFKKQIGKDSIELICHKLPFQPSLVTTDHSKLKKVFINLLHNALKFTSYGKIEFGFKKIKLNRMILFVSDTGTGIPKDQHARIFDRFNQIHTDATITREGLGLGLSIAKGLINLLHGNIWLESDTNQGTTFYFDIPYNKKKNGSKENHQPSLKNNYDWKDKSILVVEDEPWNRDFFRELLKRSGVRLIFAETGKEAIDISTKDQNIDLILMDIRLPDMNGNDVTRTIKKFKPNVPIIAQTAYAMEEDREKSLQAGSDNFITKPIQLENLFQILSGYLEKN